MRYSTLLGLAASLSTAAAQYKGFNYGASFTNGAAKQQADFENEFNLAKNLVGTSGFTSARLYTTVQHGTTNTPIAAIQAAINTKTSLLLGLWASAGQASFDNEVAALKSAIQQYGTAFTDLIVGISVGSEDLYRISPTGIINKSGVGAEPADLIRYIQQVRSAIQGTAAASKPIGHVDTWTAFVNGSNAEVISNLDWLGFDGYPYFQNTMANGIENGKQLFQDALGATRAASQGKPVWITETGWPVSGPTENQAVASIENAKTYWDEVGCPLFGNTNTWWYTLQDASPDTPSPSFGIVPGGTPSSTSSSCPANLSGTYEYPHLIVPVDSSAPTKAYGTQYNGKVSSTISSLFNFDIPASYAGKTCSLVFLLPNKKDLQTSDFTLTGAGGIAISKLSSPATEQTTFQSVPKSAGKVGEVASVTPGNSWVVSSGACEAGARVGYEVSATGGLQLEWFEDWNPSPIGLFVTVC
ncbi:ubiquitin 3 binding protein But2 C-terminal domain-containing protein [Macrophomina phaseolina]|uniref:Probable glucan endo-1,3-beta-glucosidase eglC n=1 Tax=Macrophomina phaseolina TaxID=35725 RepID=A0ABQ8GK18_9PEZI|nr:ubiquitin 3 binding protein But2 C-terminal domain-containing protein [Macrophomina phaseolina]